MPTRTRPQPLAILALLACRASGAPPAPAHDAAADLPPDPVPYQVLYELGDRLEDPGVEPQEMHADGDGIYWIQRDGWIYRGSRDGSRPAERWARLGNLVGHTLASDERRLYWFERRSQVSGALKFRDKHGGLEGEVALRWDHDGGALAVDDQHVYAAMPGCPVLTRIDKQSLVAVEMDLPPVAVSPLGGRSTLLVHRGGLLCGSWKRIVSVPGWEQPATILVDSALRVRAMTVLGDDLYWIDEPTRNTIHKVSIGRVSLATGAVTRYPEDINWDASLDLVSSPDGAWLYYAAQTVLSGFDVKNGLYKIVLPHDPTERRVGNYGRNLRSDGEHLYYFSATYRLRISRVPLWYLAAAAAR